MPNPAKPVLVATRRADAARTNRVKDAEAKSKQFFNPITAEAEEAVQVFQAEYNRLNQMNEDFRRDFPDAFAAIQDIKQQEDLVQDAIARAHPLVQQVGEDVGPPNEQEL